MNFLSELTTVQWVFLALGAFIAAPPVIEYISKFVSERKISLPVKKTSEISEHDLTDLVCKWECLADAAHKVGLHEACSKLDEVFPLLIQVRSEINKVNTEKSNE